MLALSLSLSCVCVLLGLFLGLAPIVMDGGEVCLEGFTQQKPSQVLRMR